VKNLYITLAIVAGSLVGVLIYKTNVNNRTTQLSPFSQKPLQTKSNRATVIKPTKSRIYTYLENDHAFLGGNTSFSDTKNQLAQIQASPIRSYNFIGLKTESMPLEEIIYLLEKKAFVGYEEIVQVARKLANEYPIEEFSKKVKVRAQSMQDMAYFRTAAIETWVNKDALATFSYIKNMHNSGSKSYHAAELSKHWCLLDPEQVASHYDELIKARRRTKDLDNEQPDYNLIDKITQSWIEKDSLGLDSYIQALPEGAKKEAFIKAQFELKNHK